MAGKCSHISIIYIIYYILYNYMVLLYVEDQYLESQTMSLDEGAEVSLFDDSLDEDKRDNNICNEQVNEV